MKKTKAIAAAAIVAILILMAIDEALTNNATPKELRTGGACYEIDGNILCPARGEEK